MSECNSNDGVSLRHFMQHHIMKQFSSTTIGESSNDSYSNSNYSTDTMAQTFCTNAHVESAVNLDGVVKSSPIHIISDNAKSPPTEACRSRSNNSISILPPLRKHEKPSKRNRSANHSRSSPHKRRSQHATVSPSNSVVKTSKAKPKRRVLESSSKTAQQHIEEYINRKLLLHSFEKMDVSCSSSSTRQSKYNDCDENDVSPLRNRSDLDVILFDNCNDEEEDDECFSCHHDSLSLLLQTSSPRIPRRGAKSTAVHRLNLPSSWYEGSTNTSTTTKTNNEVSDALLSSWIEGNYDEHKVDTQPNQPMRHGSAGGLEHFALSNVSTLSPKVDTQPTQPTRKVSVSGRKRFTLLNELPIALINASTMKATSRFHQTLQINRVGNNNLSSPLVSSSHAQQRGRTIKSHFYDGSSPLSVKKPERQRSWDESFCCSSSSSNSDDDDDFNFCQLMINKDIAVVSTITKDSCISSTNSNSNDPTIVGTIVDEHQKIKSTSCPSSLIAATVTSTTIPSPQEYYTALRSQSRRKLPSRRSISDQIAVAITNTSETNGSSAVASIELIDKILTATSNIDTTLNVCKGN
jgi:hypothetical protein